MDQQILIVVILGLVCFGALAIVVMVPTAKDKTKKRVSSLNKTGVARRSSGGAGQSSNEVAAKERRRKLAETLADLEDQAKKNKKRQRATLSQQLEQAGLAIKPKHFYMGSVVSALFFGFIGVISGQQLGITAALIGIGGFGVPRWYVNFFRNRRQKKFADEFSNAIDVVVRGVKSGLPVNECLKIISNEAPPPVGEEFHMLTEGIRVGMSLEQSLDRMYKRMPLQEVNFFSIVLLIQQKTGGNLAEALSNLATVLRNRKLMAGKIKALSAEAKASAMIIGSLPFLVMGAVQFSSPEYLKPLFTETTGHFILIGAGLWMSAGIFVMRNMIKIKV